MFVELRTGMGTCLLAGICVIIAGCERGTPAPSASTATAPSEIERQRALTRAAVEDLRLSGEVAQLVRECSEIVMEGQLSFDVGEYAAALQKFQQASRFLDEHAESIPPDLFSELKSMLETRLRTSAAALVATQRSPNPESDLRLQFNIDPIYREPPVVATEGPAVH